MADKRIVVCELDKPNSEELKMRGTHGWLIDGTPVEVIKSELNAAGKEELQVKPIGEETFPSGINPWVANYAVLDFNPLEEQAR